MSEAQPCPEAEGEIGKPLKASSQPPEPRGREGGTCGSLMPSFILPDTGVAGLSFGTFAWHVPNALYSQNRTGHVGWLFHPTAKNPCSGSWLVCGVEMGLRGAPGVFAEPRSTVAITMARG